MRRIYLDKVDIDSNAKLALNIGRNSLKEYILYFVSYGVMVDQVVMQGSAPMKSVMVQKVYHKMQEAFLRNEHHDRGKPIFAFSLSNDFESYSEYLESRLSKLNKFSNNPELYAYKSSNAMTVASMLDHDLKGGEVFKRKHSVDSSLKRYILNDIKRLHSVSSDIELQKDALTKLVSDMEVFQTFEFYRRGKKFIYDKDRMYKAIRRSYELANSFSNEAASVGGCFLYRWSNVNRFLKAVGVHDIFVGYHSAPNLALFEIRKISSFREILEKYYFACQSEIELEMLFLVIEKIRKYGKYGLLIKESPSSLVAYFFSELSEGNSPFKSLYKGAEHLVRSTVTETIGLHFSYGLLPLIKFLEIVQLELSRLSRKQIR